MHRQEQRLERSVFLVDLFLLHHLFLAYRPYRMMNFFQSGSLAVSTMVIVCPVCKKHLIGFFAKTIHMPAD